MSSHEEAMETLCYGVYITTCKSGDQANGLTVGWATQISLDPAIIGVSINKKWFSHKLLKESGHFIFHVLADDQIELALRFGTTHGSDCDKFEGVARQEGVAGVPIIQGCKTVLQCRKLREYDIGDHTFFVGEVVASHVDPDKNGQGELPLYRRIVRRLASQTDSGDKV